METPADVMRSVLEGLVARLSPELPGDALGEVLNRLLWLTDDNGTDIIVVCREWLRADDRRRVEAALSIDEGWLYDDRERLGAELAAAGRRWPELSPRIAEILQRYDGQQIT